MYVVGLGVFCRELLSVFPDKTLNNSCPLLGNTPPHLCNHTSHLSFPSGQFHLPCLWNCGMFSYFLRQTPFCIRYKYSSCSGYTGEGNGTPFQYSCLENPMDGGAWWAAVHGVAEGRTQLSNFTFTFHFHALEKEMATHSSVLVCRIPGTGEPGGLPSMGSHRVGHD